MWVQLEASNSSHTHTNIHKHTHKNKAITWSYLHVAFLHIKNSKLLLSSKKRVEIQTNNNLIKGNQMRVKDFELFWLRVEVRGMDEGMERDVEEHGG